jgi:PEP-CTERM motif
MKIRKMTAVALATAASLVASVASAHVFNGVGYPVYGFTESPIAQDTQLSLGFTFTVTAPTVIIGLGYWDQNGDGFLTPHEVGIFLGDGADGPGPLLVSTVLAAGKSGVLVAGGAWADPAMAPSGFRYQQTTALMLVPGQSYTIAGLSPNLDPAENDPWVYGGPSETNGFRFGGALTTGLGYAKNIAIGPDAARYAYDTPTLTDPSLHYSDYQFYAVNMIAAPEPTTWTMMLLGFAGLGYLRSRHVRSARITSNIE